MKCPKCGFTGFDHLDDCKKCGADLTELKARFNLRGPLYAGTFFLLATPPSTREVEIVDPPGPAAAPTDFGYDFMGEESPSPAVASPHGIEEGGGDGFSFDEVGDRFAGEAEEEEGFTLETTSAAVRDDTEDARVAATGEGEFLDLELDLSWDEKPTVPAGMPTAAQAPSADDSDFDFPSLDDLPPLENSFLPEEAPLDDGFLDDLGDLPDFSGFQDKPQPPENPNSSEKEGEPRDPFDFRGSVPAERTPVNPEIAAPAPPCPPLPEQASERTPPREGKEFLPSAAEFFPEEDLEGGSEPWSSPPPALRLAATMADGMILAAGFALFVVAGQFAMAAPRDEIRLFPSPERMADLLIPYFLVLFFLCFSYSTLFHFLLGQTAGKMLFRLRVAGENEGPILFPQAFVRSAVGILSFICAGAGYLPLLRGRPAWNDRLAGTRVLRLRPAAPEQD